MCVVVTLGGEQAASGNLVSKVTLGKLSFMMRFI